MSARNWYKGAPPQVGWWNARTTWLTTPSPTAETWGWWNGEKWSEFADENESLERAAEHASRTGAADGRTGHVEWSDYYPEGARVPRFAA